MVLGCLDAEVLSRLWGAKTVGKAEVRASTSQCPDHVSKGFTSVPAFLSSFAPLSCGLLTS